MNPYMIKGKMAECGKTQRDLAKAVGMSANSLSRKLSGKRDFTLAEVGAMCSALGIDDPRPYFFDDPSHLRNKS